MKTLIPRYHPILLILALSALLWAGEYMRRGLWEPDEGRYALVTREMVDAGDWLVMHRQGEPYAHKPPLFFWLAGLASLAGGGDVSRLAVRLPSFLGSVLSLWAVFRLSRRWFSEATAWLAVLLLSTSYLFWNKGGFGQIDALLCGLELTALYLLYTAHEGRTVWRQAGAYAAMGLAILAKGPVGLIVPLGIYAASRRTISGYRSHGLIHFLWGVPVALLFPATWLLLAWWTGAPPEYLNELLFAQNVGRAAGEFGGHVQPFYYFLKYLPVDFLPWTFLIPLAWAALGKNAADRVSRRRLLLWIGFVVVFFSLSASKRNLYILSAYPAAAILVAAGVSRMGVLSRRWIAATLWAMTGLTGLLAAVLLAAPFVSMDHEVPFAAIAPGCALAAGLFFAHKSYRVSASAPGWIVALGCGYLAAFSLVGTLVYPAFNEMKAPSAIVEPARRLVEPDEKIIMYLQHGEMISLYSGRMGKMVFSGDQLRAFLQKSSQRNYMVVCYDYHLDYLRNAARIIDGPYEFHMGNKSLFWALIDQPGQ